MSTLHVAVGAIVDVDSRVLLTRRASSSHQGGLWEFPGGKVEPGEDVLQALARELEEELGITPTATEPLLEVRHDYGDRRVLLDVHLVRAYSGQPQPLEAQPMCWVAVAELDQWAFPEANLAIVSALQAMGH